MKRRSLYIIPFLLLFLHTAHGQSTSWTGTTSTAWATATNWSNGVPTASLDVVIGDASFTGASQPSITASAVAKSITIGTGVKVSTLTIAHTLTVSNNVTIGSNGTISQTTTRTSRPFTVKGNIVSNGTFTASSTSSRLTMAGTAQSISGSGTTFTARQLYINTGSTTTVKRNITISNTLNITGTVDPDSTLNPIVSGTGTLTINSGGRLKVRTSTFAGNYTISGTKTYNSGSTVEFTSNATAQSIASGNAPGTGFRNLILSGTATKTLTSSIIINASNFTLSGGTFDCSTFLMRRSAAGGTFTISSGTTYRTANTGTNPLDSNFSTAVINSSSTVEYYAASGIQTIRSRTYGRLVLSGGGTRTSQSTAFTVSGSLAQSGTLTFSPAANITVNGNDTIGSGTTFSAGSFTHTLKGSLVNNGTLTGGSSTIALQGSNAAVSGSGSFTFQHLTVSGSGITVSSASSVTMSGNLSTTGSGTLTHTSGGAGTWTMSGSGRTITGTGIMFNRLTIAGGASVSTTSDLTVAGTFVTTGSFTASAGTVTLSGSGTTWSGGGTVALHALTISGSVTGTQSFSLNGDLSVTGSYTASAGTTTFNGTSTLSGTANLFDVTLNGTSLQLGSNATLGVAGTLTLTAGTLNVTTTTPNTVAFNGTAAQSVPAATYHHLTLSNTGAKTNAGALTVNGNLTIGSGTSYNAGASLHTLYGDLINGGTFTAGSSTVTFAGGSDVSITGSTQFNTLIVSKSSSINQLTLNDDVTAATATITTGELITGTKKITVTSQRTGNGTIIGTIVRTHAFTTGTAYAFESPFNTITFSSVSGVTSVSVTTTLASIADFTFGGAVNREYTVAVTGGPYVAALRLHYLTSELNGNEKEGLQLWRYGSSWTNYGTSGSDTASRWTEIDTLSALNGRWTLAEFTKVVRWTGAVSSAWELAGNWAVVQGSASTPPAATDVCQLGGNAFTNQPSIASSVSVRGIQFGSAQAVTLTIASGSLTTAGNIDGQWSASRTHSIAAGNAAMNIGGSIVLSDGTAGHDIGLTYGNGTITVTGSVDVPGNAALVCTGSGTLNIGGDLTVNGGTFTRGSGTVRFNGTEAQTIAGVTYHALQIDKASGTASLAADATVTQNLTVTAGILDADANITVSGNIAILSGGTFNGKNSTVTFGGNWSNAGTFSGGGGTVNLNGGGDQTIGATSFNHLTVNKGSGTASPIATLSIGGDLTVSSGTLDMGSFTAHRSVVGGTLTLGSGALLRLSGNANFPQNYSSNTLQASSTVEYYGASVETVAAVTYGNLTIANGSGNERLLVSPASVAGTLTVASGGTFNIGGTTLTLNGNLTNNGTLSATTGTIQLAGSGRTISGTTTVKNLSVFGTYTAQNDITIQGSLVVTGSLATGGTTLTLSGDVSNSGTITNSGIVVISGDSARTLAFNDGFTSTGTVQFNGTALQTFTDATVPVLNTVSISNTSGIVPSVGWTVLGNVTIASGATFNGGAFNHSFKGSVTNNGTLTGSGTFTFNPTSPVTLALSGTSFSQSGTVVFGGSGAITLSSSALSFTNITVASTSAVTATGIWTVSGTVTVSSGAQLNAGSFSHSFGGDLLVDGTFSGGTSLVSMTNTSGSTIGGSGTMTFYDLTIASSAVITASADLSVQRNFTNDGTFTSDGIILTFTGGTASSIGGASSPYALDRLRVQKSSATVTLAAAVNGLSDVTITSGTLDLSTFAMTEDGTDKGAITMESGTTLRIGGSNSFPTFTDGYTLHSTSTVEYYGASQTVSSAPSYGNLTIAASGATTISSATYTIAGTMTLSSGTVSAGNAAALNIAGNYAQSGGTFSGGNTSAFSITGNFTLSSGTFTPSTNATTHTIGGHWTMSGGTFTNTNTTIRFNGTGTQTVSTTGAFNSITVNKASGGLSLGTNVTVNGVLTLTSGNIVTNSFSVILPSAASVSRTSGHIVGNLQKNVATGAAVRTYEIGDASAYTPLTITFANVTVSGNLTAATASGDHADVLNSGINPNKSVNRTWTLTNSGVTFTTYSTVFTFVAGDLDAGATTGNFNVSKRTASAWAVQTAGTRTATTTQATGIAAFGEFQIGESGKVWNGSVDNNWNTAANWTPSGVPTAVDAVTIGTATAVNVNTAAVTADLTAGNASLVLTIQSGNSLSVSGNFAFTAGTLNTQTAFPTISGTTTLSGGTVGYTGTGAQSITKQQYVNLTVSGARTTNSVTFPTDTISISGTFTASATFTSGGYVTTGSTVRYNGSGGQSIIPLSYHNLLITGSRSDSVKFDSSAVIAVAGTLSPNATFTSGVFSLAGSTVVFNGTGAQTIPALNYQHLTISGARGGATVTVSNTDTVGIAGTFTPSATAVVYAQTGAIFEFNGTSAQTVPAFTYNGLVLSNSGTKSITTDITSSNDLVNRAGTTVNIGAVNVQVLGTLTNAGTIVNDGTVQTGN